MVEHPRLVGGGRIGLDVAPGQYLDIQQENRSFAEMSISRGRVGTLLGRDEPQRVEALETSSSLFHLLGAKPLHGRLLRPEEDAVGLRGLELAGAGVVLGVLGAAALTRVMTSLLFGISATDPITFSTVPLILIATAMLASYVSARRATRVDPVVALREE